MWVVGADVETASRFRVPFIPQGLKTAALCFVLFWAMDQPELRSLVDRIHESGGLWDWRLILPAIALTLYYIYDGLRPDCTETDAAHSTATPDRG